MEYAEILHRCFRCGYCKLPGNYIDFNCPAYLAFRFETFLPGGRMWLLRAWQEKKLKPSRRFQEIMFACTACRNCVEQCALPKIKDQLLAAFTAGKAALADEGKVPPSVRDCLTHLQSYGNIYGLARKKRSLWVMDTGVETYSDQEFLFFPGDVGGFDSRGQEIARSVARLLKHLDISFGILGHSEVSDGNEALAMGEKELFRLLAEENIKQFNELNVKKIIALSPHGFHALKNEYPALGGSYRVFHYTQILAAHMGGFSFKEHLPKINVTYHDPCYLGRHNLEYGSARKILAGLPGIEVREMDRNMKNALCCGGGGGNLFTDILGNGPESPAGMRAAEALNTGASLLAVSCPACAIILEDAVKSTGIDDRLQVREVSEIITDRIG